MYDRSGNTLISAGHDGTVRIWKRPNYYEPFKIALVLSMRDARSRVQHMKEKMEREQQQQRRRDAGSKF